MHSLYNNVYIIAGWKLGNDVLALFDAFVNGKQFCMKSLVFPLVNVA